MTERAPILPLTPNPLLKRMRRRPIPARARKWLNAEGSLTRRLKAVCDTVHIQILHQRQAALWPLEKKALGRQRHQQGGATHVRTVLQWCGEPDTAFPGVFARSAVLAPQARLSWGSLRGLGNRPLAHLLFVAPGIRRTPLFYQYDPPHAPETRHVLRQWQQQAGAHADRNGFFFIPDVDKLANGSGYPNRPTALLAAYPFVERGGHASSAAIVWR